MRWKTKARIPMKNNSCRKSIRFAWFPVQTRDNKTVWLERYILVERLDTLSMKTEDLIIFESKTKWQSIDAWSQESTMWEGWVKKF